MRLSRRTLMAGLAVSGCASLAPVRPAPTTFPAADGVAITALRYGGGPRGVVLVPGGHGVGETWDAQARRLAQAGFHVLAIDYRGRGRSRGGQDDTKAHLDVLGAVRRLKADGARDVAVVGASWGGYATGMAAVAEPGLIDRVMLLAHSPFEGVERLSGRKLFVVARDDSDGTGAVRLDAIRRQFDAAPEPKELLVLDGAAHAQFLFLTPVGERLYAAMLRFLS